MQEKGDAGKAGKPRGAPRGHRGATSRPKPTEFEEHTPDKCPRCGSARLRVTDTECRDITEVPPPPGAVTTRHEINTCACRACGEEEILLATGLPSAGNYGRNVIAQVVSNHVERMPFRRNASAVRGLEMSSTTPHNIMRRVGVCLGRPTGEIAASMRRAAVVHADETSIRLNGVKVWVRIFFDPATGHALFVVRPGRGGGGGRAPGGARGGVGRDPRMRRMDVVQEIPRAAVPGPHNPGDAPRRGKMRVQKMQRGARNAAQDIRRRVQYRVVAHVGRPGAPRRAAGCTNVSAQ